MFISKICYEKFLKYIISRYNKISRDIRELVRKIKELDTKDPFRMESSSTLLEKL